MTEPGWCPDCGLAENDPQHPAWHKVLTWNADVFASAEAKRQAEFDKELETHQHRVGRKRITGRKAVPENQTALDTSDAVSTRHRYEGERKRK